ncbi:MAG: bifunctional proline dehydrogenase/L-glutamate gamma-semialdehyde dehydrogenase [Microbacteriaceae bacterium]|nr:bifunctional proline dehydrogenase/L-glutamate gamma-semialdehyde dehydrogenase [Microbacteriaceae bacterium]
MTLSEQVGKNTSEISQITEQSVELAKSWSQQASQAKSSPAAERLAGLLADPDGLYFAVGFIDGVVRPEDNKVAANALARVSKRVPKFLPLPLRGLVKLGGLVAPILPWPVIPIAKKVLRGFVQHLVIDATDSKLTKSLKTISAEDVTLNINLLGEAVLGESEAKSRYQKLKTILERKDVSYVSLKVSSIIAPHPAWAFEESVEKIVETLRPLYRLAASSNPPKFINLDMEEYKDLRLTIEVFKKILSEQEFMNLKAGIVLQAYLPDAIDEMKNLQTWAAERVSRGGSAIKIRLVKGANLPLEIVDAEMHDWPLATVESKQAADANFKRVLDYALTPERTKNLRVGIAGHNLFDLAFGYLLAEKRGCTDGIDVEMLLGMAEAQAEAVKQTIGGLVLYTPVVHPSEFDVAIAYLIRRLEEGASTDNFMSGLFELEKDKEVFQREEMRFRASVSDLSKPDPKPNRTPRKIPSKAQTDFENVADTDPSVPENLEWANQILIRAKTSQLGVKETEQDMLLNEKDLNKVISKAVKGHSKWQKLGTAKRVAILKKVAVELEKNRAELLEVMASEAGKTIEQGDPEVSEAIDFANYYAELSEQLDALDGATHKPEQLVLVTPPWNFPTAIPAGSSLAALAAGSAVIFKPAGQVRRTGALIARIFHKAGVPKDVMLPVQISEKDLGKQLITHEEISRVILTGGYETAELFRSFRPDLPLLAETSGKNALVVTPSADLDLAAKDLAYSAFGHAGQKCSAASIAILVGTVADSERFNRQLLDAVEGLVVDFPTNPNANMGPIIEAPSEKLAHGLETLDNNEHWIVKPEALNNERTLWSPGVRGNVEPGAPSHLKEYFGPVLAIMRAKNLEEALEIQNAVDYGLTAGIHSLDPKEINYWLSNVQAGNLYINRGITGAIVQRQPFGGWKRSAIGPGAKAGGPSYLLGFGSFESKPANNTAKINSSTRELIKKLPTADLERVAGAYEYQLQEFFQNPKDRTGLSAEKNIFRHLRDEDALIWLDQSATEADVDRALVLANTLGSVKVMASEKWVDKASAFNNFEISSVENLEQMISQKPLGLTIRWVGEKPDLNKSKVLSSPDVAIFTGEVTESGRRELLPFFKEQAVSITAHRFGNPLPMLDEVFSSLTR